MDKLEGAQTGSGLGNLPQEERLKELAVFSQRRGVGEGDDT